MKRYLPFAIIAGVLVVALAGGAVLWRSSKQAETPTQPFTSPTPAAAATPAQQGTPAQTPARPPTPSGPDNAHARGALNSKVTLEEYGDYQCPSCGGLYHELKILEKDYGEEVRFVFRQFPLQGHKHALIAAKAAEAAGLQGRFWEMHDMIYQNQLSWSGAEDARPVFLQYAQLLKLDLDRFSRDLDSAEVATRVNSDYDRGVASGVTGTPTIFINGRQLQVAAMTDEGMRAALDYMLGKRK